MRNIIAGTAGHIDHGKTALVRALTGIETDRLEEEKRRGISIDIGFAHLMLDGGVRLGFVDVPGHERFVKNMLAGAGGIDLVLLVVAADESIKPQTREHFDICRLLGIERGVVVITKSDLVDGDLLGLVKLEAEEFVAGSFLEGAPVVAVSSVTGAGLDELKRTLAELALQVRTKDAKGRFRLPLDRSFSLKGFGTVVTGTTVSGTLAAESEVEVQPGGRRLRVRGLQVHGQAAAVASAGQRTAVNLAGVEPSELQRGMTLIEPGALSATRRIDCVIELLDSAKPLKHRAPVHFHAWTSETEAEVRLLEGDVLKPGTIGVARLILRDPVHLLPGDRFIIRKFSPVVTVGGGRVADASPPEQRRRADLGARTRALAAASPSEYVERLVAEAPFGAAMAALADRMGLTAKALEAAVKPEQLIVVPAPAAWVLHKDRAAAIESKLHETVAAFHRANPLLPGIAKEQLRTGVLPGSPPFLLDWLAARSKTLTVEGDLMRLRSHKLTLKGDEEEALGRIESAFEKAGLSVPSLGEVLTQSGVEAGRSRSLLQILLREKKLVRISDELVFHRAAVAHLREIMAARKGQRFAVPAFKEWTGVSRKYAIPLLEYLDRERVTRREGDERVVL